MDHTLSCEICNYEYNSTTVIPRVLNCGHSFCTACIKKLNKSVCPRCRATIPFNTDFPVNYLILSLIDECKTSRTNIQPDTLWRVQNLREKLSYQLAVIKSVISVKSQKEKDIEKDLKILEALEKENLELDVKKKDEARPSLNQLEKRYEDLLDKSLSFFDDPDDFADFSIKKSSTVDVLLQEIYYALKRSERVFAFKWTGKKLKFGELTFRDNKIFIHSLTLDKVPNNSKSVQFQDLKEATIDRTFHIYFEIAVKNETSHMIIIKLEDAKLCPNFIKLCTGESGPTYKDVRYRKGETYTALAVKPFFVTRMRRAAVPVVLAVDIPEQLPADYYGNLPKSVACMPNEVVVTATPDDGFQLFRIASQGNYEIIGKVIYPFDIWNQLTSDNDFSNHKILDCGIIIEF